MTSKPLRTFSWSTTKARFYYIIEEYLDTILNRIAISRFQVKNLVLTGSQLELVAQLCEAKERRVSPIKSA